MFLLISLVVSRNFVLGREAAFGKMETVLKVWGMVLESGGCFLLMSLTVSRDFCYVEGGCFRKDGDGFES